MNHIDRTARPAAAARLAAAFVFVSLLAALPAHTLQAQAITQAGAADTRPADPTGKKVLSVADYSRWRSIDATQMSGDGKWVTYGLRFSNVPAADAKPVLHILKLDSNEDIAIADASQPSFSPDSRWVVYQVEPPAGRGGRGARGASPDSAADTSAAGRGRGAATAPAPQRRIELRELATGQIQSWQDVQSATFSPTATHLLLRRRPAGGGGAPAGAAAGAAPGGPPAGAAAGGGAGGGGTRGADMLLHDLSTRRSHFLGSVGEASFNRRGDLLAYTVDAAQRDGNGLFVIDLKTGKTHVLDNDARNYTRLTWNDDGSAIAILKTREVPRMRERESVLITYRNVRAAMEAQEPSPVRLDPATANNFPRGWVIADRAGLSWSDDNKRIFFGIIGQTPAPDTSRRRSADSVADVDVWRTQDERIQSVQMNRAEAERNFTFRQAFDLDGNRYVALTDSSMRDLELAPDGRWAVGRDTRAYVSDYERPRADFYRVNTSTGERTLMFKGQLTGQHALGISPNGKHFLFWKDARFHQYDLDAGTTQLLGTGAPSFVNLDFDHPGPKPSFGVAGYSADGSSVIVHHQYDLWSLPLDGSAGRNITNAVGNRNEIQFRYVRTEPADPMAPRAAREGRVIDFSKPVTLSAYGEWTKKSGYYELAGGNLREVVFEDASFSTPSKAAKADRFMFTRQTFAEFPDLRISDGDFSKSRKITNANPQQAEYAWGRRQLFEYKIKSGRKLQGILALPDDYKQGEKRPMIVTFYEKNSQNMHRYSSPSFLTGMGGSPIEAVSRGYITMLPDVHFHTGSSHSDMLDAVEAATRKVIEMGYVDAKRIGVHGHSYGGEGAAFIATRSKMFAAVGVGAGVSDLYSDFMQSWGWSYQVTGGSGANAFDYYIYGQGRWGFSPWDKPEVYRFESAITHAPNVVAPVLIMHGTADPTVSFTEGLNFYSALRYNKKDAILLAYPGEGHGLRGLANRRDLTIRYFQFFDHYLKGSPAPKWMTEGVPFLVKDTVREPK